MQRILCNVCLWVVLLSIYQNYKTYYTKQYSLYCYTTSLLYYASFSWSLQSTYELRLFTNTVSYPVIGLMDLLLSGLSGLTLFCNVSANNWKKGVKH